MEAYQEPTHAARQKIACSFKYPSRSHTLDNPECCSKGGRVRLWRHAERDDGQANALLWYGRRRDTEHCAIRGPARDRHVGPESHAGPRYQVSESMHGGMEVWRDEDGVLSFYIVWLLPVQLSKSAMYYGLEGTLNWIYSPHHHYPGAGTLIPHRGPPLRRC